MKNGVVLIGGFGSDGTARRVFDMQIMNQWPVIPIAKNLEQIHKDWGGKQYTTQNLDHLSIPPDLQLHFSPSHDFVRKDLVNSNGELSHDTVHLLSWFSQPINNYPAVQNLRKDGRCALIFLTADQRFSERTGIFVEVFAHREQAQADGIISLPFSNETMRFVGNAHKPILTMWYRDMLRHKNPIVDPKYFLSLRFGFWENNNKQTVFAIPPQV